MIATPPDTDLLPPHPLDLLQCAFDALQRTTGLIAKVAPKVDRPIGRRPDAIVEIDIGGHTHRYAAQLKRIDRFATLGAVKKPDGPLRRAGIAHRSAHHTGNCGTVPRTRYSLH